MRFVHHTWQWLASRLPVQTIWRDQHAATSRPCLPTAELLGDRVMLDAAPVLVEGIKGEGDAQILIGLIKGELTLSLSQIGTLGLASKIDASDEAIKKLAEEWADVGDVLSKFGEALIKGEVQGKKFDKFAGKLSAELGDIKLLASELDIKGELLVPAVQKVSAEAVDVFLKLGDIKLSEDLKWQDEHVLVKVGELFSKVDDLLLKFAADVLTGGFLKEQIKGELEAALVKIDFFASKAQEHLVKGLDADLGKLLVPAIQSTFDAYANVLEGLVPGDGPNDNPTFEGGVTSESTDDLVSEA